MSIQYTPGPNQPPLKLDRCKALALNKGRGFTPTQCTRRPQFDGWCIQHHPVNVKRRARKRAERKAT